MFDVVRDVTSVCIQADLPTLLWSPPGQGKTSFASQIANQLGYKLVVVIGSIRDPMDFLGNPVLSPDGFVDMAPPRLAQVLSDPNTLLLIDELTTCPQQTQAALLRISHERYVGEIPVYCKIMAAANPPGEAVAGMDIASAMSNRYGHIGWEMNATDYAHGLATNWQYTTPWVGEGWQNSIPKYEQLVGRFLSSFRTELLNFPPAEGEYAFASPRSWSFAAKFLAAHHHANLTPDHQRVGLRAFIGSGPATEFQSWLALQSTVSLEDIVSAPQTQLDTIKNEHDDVVAAVFNGIADMVGGPMVDDRRFHTVVKCALEKGFAASIMMAALTRASQKLSHERYVAVERTIKKHQAAWEGVSNKKWENKQA